MSAPENNGGIPPRPIAPLRHALVVGGGFVLLFAWLFAQPILRHGYLAESDLYEFFLPQFLSPRTIWSVFEFGGMPAFADPGDATVYPLQMAGRLLGSWTALIVMTYALGGSAMYAYVYSLTRSQGAALVSGLAYALSEAMMERMAHFGLLSTIAWFPLVLLAIDRLRGPHPLRWIAVGGFVTGACLLAGNPQTFLYAGYICAIYTICGGLVERAGLRFYAAAAAMVALAALMTMAKTAPVIEASLLTARQVVRYDAFAGHANTPAQMLSMLFPTIAHEGREAPTYVGLLTLIFSLASLRRLRSDWRVAFWAGIVVLALLIGAGDATPVARLAFGLPFYDKFRIGARHLVFAALGFATLAGLGVAATSRRDRAAAPVAIAALAVVATLIAGAFILTSAPDAFTLDPRPELPWVMPGFTGEAWPQILLGLLSATAALACVVRPGRTATLALALLLTGDLLYALPYTLTPTGLELPLLPDAAAQPSVHARTLAAGAAPLHQRLLAPDGTHVDAVAPALFARLWRIPIAGGYGPMLLARYGTLAMMGTNGSVEPLVLAEHNAALDLLAVRYVMVHAEGLAPEATVERHGITWTAAPLGLPVGPQECGDQPGRVARYALPAGVPIARVAIDAHLWCADNAPQGAAVATVKVIGGDGVVHEQTLHAGVEIADSSLRSPEMIRRAKHAPATVFDPDDERYSYVTSIALPTPLRDARIEITVGASGGAVAIDRLTAIDTDGRSHPQSQLGAMLGDTTRWAQAGRFATSRTTDRARDDDVPGEQPYAVFENRRARPLAWLAREVLPLDDRQAETVIHQSLLPNGRRFDPAVTAIVEAGTVAATTAPAGPSAVEVRSIDDGAIRLAVSSKSGGVLVLSQAHYPGWQVTIDDAPATLLRTDIALQGVAVPAGTHAVVFRFDSRTRRAGIAGSLGALALMGVFLWRDRAGSRSPSR